MQGRQRELEVGAGGPADKRKSIHSRFICFWLPCLDDGVGLGKEKKERDGKEKRREGRNDGGGGGVGGVWWSCVV